jgi:hypothetical protein
MNEEIIPANADEVGCDCGMCDKCMGKAMCTPGSPDCGDMTCKVCAVKKDMIDTSSTPENPSAHLNPAAGMKHPELHNPNDPTCKCMKCMMTKGCTDMTKDCGDPMCKVCAKKADDFWGGSAFAKKDYNSKQRQQMASRGQAMEDGSFPIATARDLQNAIQSVGRASSYEAAKKHIMSRARALGLTDMLPEDWKK